MTGFANDLIRQHFVRTGAPQPTAIDAAYQYQMTLLREMLTRLEIILEDEGVEQAAIERVLRCMLYGAPSEAEALMRMEQQERLVDLAGRVPPDLTWMVATPRGTA